MFKLAFNFPKTFGAEVVTTTCYLQIYVLISFVFNLLQPNCGLATKVKA
jgi:hypothetical protein